LQHHHHHHCQQQQQQQTEKKMQIQKVFQGNSLRNQSENNIIIAKQNKKQKELFAFKKLSQKTNEYDLLIDWLKLAAKMSFLLLHHRDA
jgi:CRISPR/Cas system CMR subunit Cmr4 (Cas7 group RAMP superfamily)